MQPGQRIGKYVLGERIAVGGMAEVWAARAEGPEGFVKPVALKFILESFSGDPDLERLFFKEARIAAQLQHANLVSVFDFDRVVVDPERGPGGRYYIAMEHVEGHDARRVVEAAKHAGHVFPMPLALYLAGEVCKGLRYVHERREHGRSLGLVHRDVSPHNVLVGFSGEVKLSDFGIAKSLAHSSRTKTGTVRGKLSYASPEQLNGEPVDHRTDQFALGITLWEILAGRPLFDGNDEVEIVGKVIRCDVPSLALIGPDRKFPPEVEATVRRMLSPARERRFPSTADALSALLALPGYTADGVGLGDLVRTLFHRAGAVTSSTMSFSDPRARETSAAGPRRARGRDAALVGPTRARDRAARLARGDGAANESPAGELATRTMARPVGEDSGARRWPVSGRRDALTTEPVAPARSPRRWAMALTIAVVALGTAAVVAVVVGRGGGGDSAAAHSSAEPSPAPPAAPSTAPPSPRAPSAPESSPPSLAGARSAAPSPSPGSNEDRPSPAAPPMPVFVSASGLPDANRRATSSALPTAGAGGAPSTSLPWPPPLPPPPGGPTETTSPTSRARGGPSANGAPIVE